MSSESVEEQAILESIRASFDGFAITVAGNESVNGVATHWAVCMHPDGVTWSNEQLLILHDFASALENGERIRMVINACAGSGKTTLLQAMLIICSRLAPNMKTVASAFNKHISGLLKMILTHLKKDFGFIGATVIGDSNGVQAAGRRLIFDEAKAHGFEIQFPSKERPGSRVQKFCRMIVMEYFVNNCKAETKRDVEKNVNTMIGDLFDDLEVRFTSQGFTKMAGANGLAGLVNTLMDYAFVPTDNEKDDLIQISSIMAKVGGDVGYGENYLNHVSHTVPAFTLARNVLDRMMTTSWIAGPHRPLYTISWPNAVKSVDKSLGVGDTLVPTYNSNQFTYGNLSPAWKTDLHKQSNAYEVLKANWVVSGDNGGSVKMDLEDAKCRIIQMDDGTLKVYLKSAPTASTKRPDWGGIQVKQYIKNNGGRWDGTAWSGIKNGSIVEAALIAGFKMDKDEPAEDLKIKTHGTLDFAMADMTWLPIAFDLKARLDLAQMVMVDEVQDLSVAKAQLLHRIADVSTSSFILVGDLKQAIYGWAGADSRALQSNAEMLGCIEYPMTYCWRNSHRVAQAAVIRCEQATKEVLSLYPDAAIPDYASHHSPTHIPGWAVGALPVRIHAVNVVETIQWLQSNVKNANGENQIIIGCRLNAPLGHFIITLIRAGIPISTPAGDDGIVSECLKLMKRDAPKHFSNPPKTFGYGLGLIDVKKDSQYSLKAKSIGQVLNDCKSIKDALLSTATQANGNDGAAALQDSTYTETIGTVELIEALIGLMPNDKNTNFSVKMFETFCDDLFAGGDGAVKLSTIHRIKGGEGTVFMPIEEALITSKSDDGGEVTEPKAMFMNQRAMEQSEASAIQEINICYVAWTRSKIATLPIYYSSELENQNIPALLEWAFDDDVSGYEESDNNGGDDGDAINEPKEPKEAQIDEGKCVSCEKYIVDGDEVTNCDGCDAIVHSNNADTDFCSSPTSLDDMFESNGRRTCNACNKMKRDNIKTFCAGCCLEIETEENGLCGDCNETNEITCVECDGVIGKTKAGKMAGVIYDGDLYCFGCNGERLRNSLREQRENQERRPHKCGEPIKKIRNTHDGMKTVDSIQWHKEHKYDLITGVCIRCGHNGRGI